MRFSIFLFFCIFYVASAQIAYHVQEIYKPINKNSVNVLPGDMFSGDYEISDIKEGIGKDYSDNSLKKIAEKFYKDVDSTEQNILEELDQLKELLGERSLILTIF